MRAAAAGIIVVVAVLGVLFRDFLADDAFITLAFARSLVETGAPSLGGHNVNALSSPLWFGVSTLLVAGFGPDLAPLALKFASAAGTVAAGVLTFALARRLTDDARLQGLAVVLLLADAWMGRWSWSGMEASWAAAAVVLGLLLREQGKGLEGAILLVVVGVQLRPELGLFGVLLGVEACWRMSSAPPTDGRLRRIRQAAAPMAVGVVLVIGWGFAALHWFGQVEPQSAAIKAGVLSPPAAAVQALKVIAVGQGVALALLLVRGAETMRRAWVALAWLGLLTAFYVVQGYEPLSRYLLLGLVGVPAYAAAGVDRRWALPAMAGAVILGGAVTMTVTVPTSSGDMVRFYRDVGDEVEPGSRLATWEIGALGYYEIGRASCRERV